MKIEFGKQVKEIRLDITQEAIETNRLLNNFIDTHGTPQEDAERWGKFERMRNSQTYLEDETGDGMPRLRGLFQRYGKNEPHRADQALAEAGGTDVDDLGEHTLRLKRDREYRTFDIFRVRARQEPRQVTQRGWVAGSVENGNYLVIHFSDGRAHWQVVKQKDPDFAVAIKLGESRWNDDHLPV